MAKQFLVIDGADEGRVFPLPEAGLVTIGNSRRNTDICLHDLLASRVHCEVEVDGDRVVVTDMDDSTGTFVNGQKVRQQELQFGDVVRAGNSYLRLQPAGSEETAAAAAADENEAPLAEAAEPAKLPHLTADHLTELTGHLLAHYELGPVLGKGHHGVVFRARDLKDESVVAVKVLSPDFPKNDAEMQRFVQTVRGTFPLRHDHVVTLLGAGKAGPYCWLALEHVEGESLTQVIQRLGGVRKIDWRRAFRVAVHIGRALEYAHEHQFIHRNVTAQNILWQTADKVAKLNDLVLARSLQGSLVKQMALRAKVESELPYLSPEQTHSTAYVDGLSDLYGLGVALYALLTGRLPFEGGSLGELVQQIRNVPPTPPTKLQPTVPARFEKAVLKLLAKRQEDRYQTPADLLAVLEQVAEEEEVPF